MSKSSLTPSARGLRKRMTPEEIKLWQTLRQIDGGQHDAPAQRAKDRARDKHLEQAGFIVLRFWNNEINQNMAGVIDTILPCLDRRRLEAEQENV